MVTDMVIFMGLLNDLFPGTDPPRKRDEAFEKVIEEVATGMGLTPEANFVLRVVQMSELLAIRHCIFLMGPTGVGRTEAYRVLAKAMEKGVDGNIVNDYLRINNKRKVTIRDINPKSVSTQEFYGYVNLATREWKDGLMSYYMRELANVPNEDPKWIMLDGDLDANWRALPASARAPRPRRRCAAGAACLFACAVRHQQARADTAQRSCMAGAVLCGAVLECAGLGGAEAGARRAGSRA